MSRFYRDIFSLDKNTMDKDHDGEHGISCTHLK